MSDNPPRLAYSVSEAYRALGIGRTRFYELIAEGKIQARRCGGRTLIPADALADFLARLPSV